jgi:hypothetical protein
MALKFERWREESRRPSFCDYFLASPTTGKFRANSSISAHGSPDVANSPGSEE